MDKNDKHTGKFLQGLPFFSKIPESALNTFLEAATIKDYPKRTPIFYGGDPAYKFHIIHSGWVKLYNTTMEGKEVVIGVPTRGEVIFDGNTHLCSAEAIEHTTLIEIPLSVLQKCVNADPAVREEVIALMTHDLENMQIANGRLALMNGSERLACLLVRLSSWMVGRGGRFNLPYDKSIAAAQLGLDKASFSRILKKLESKGVTCRKSEISIDDFAALSEYCYRSCPVYSCACAQRQSNLRLMVPFQKESGKESA